jgi:hypothetical protein
MTLAMGFAHTCLLQKRPIRGQTIRLGRALCAASHLGETQETSRRRALLSAARKSCRSGRATPVDRQSHSRSWEEIHCESGVEVQYCAGSVFKKEAGRHVVVVDVVSRKRVRDAGGMEFLSIRRSSLRCCLSEMATVAMSASERRFLDSCGSKEGRTFDRPPSITFRTL